MAPHSMIDEWELGVCRYKKLEDEKDKLLRFEEDSKMSAFKSLFLKEESKDSSVLEMGWRCKRRFAHQPR